MEVKEDMSSSSLKNQRGTSAVEGIETADPVHISSIEWLVKDMLER